MIFGKKHEKIFMLSKKPLATIFRLIGAKCGKPLGMGEIIES